MTIKVKYIYNDQSIELGSGFRNYQIAAMNQSRFDYTNARLNGLVMAEWSDEKLEAYRGDY